ncbi:MAG: carotenoid oxygenase family protein [Akkermansiaceae bacterium]|nr:carotenoid oxygenase family protein [Akkermansiaceae bacterium]
MRVQDRAQTFNLMPHFVQHIANAWTERISPTQQLLHIVYVGYETMPDFGAWSGSGRNFVDIDPEEQPRSVLMHATLRIPGTSGHLDHTAAVSQPIQGMDKVIPPSNPLLKPFLKSSVRMTSGSRPPDLRSMVASADTPKPSTDSSQDRLALHNAPALQPLPQSLYRQTTGCTRVVSSRVLEFPSVNPHRETLPVRYVFGAAALHPHKNRPQQAIAMYDLHTGICEYWSRGWRYYVGEPEMIPSVPEHRRPDIEKELDGVQTKLPAVGES